MSTQPTHSKTSDIPTLSIEGQSRRDEMLSDLQNAITLHHARRQNRKRAFKLSALVLVLISSGSWMIVQSMKSKGLRPDTTAEINTSDIGPKSDSTFPGKVEPTNGESLNKPHSSIHQPTKKKTLMEKYVVSTENIETRTMETIDDEEMLKLLKQAGVQGWIAEIGDERVVLDKDGKRL